MNLDDVRTYNLAKECPPTSFVNPEYRVKNLYCIAMHIKIVRKELPNGRLLSADLHVPHVDVS